jgi:hypothetical protein
MSMVNAERKFSISIGRFCWTFMKNNRYWKNDKESSTNPF